MLNTALFWYSQGISVIPLKYRSKKPIVKWKRYQEQLPTIDQLIKWFTGPKRNLALITGNNLAVLDFDNPQQYAEWYCWQIEHNLTVTETYMVQSARGLHLYYWIQDNFEPVKSVEPYEIKSHGRMINIPPSVHPSGIPYKAVNSPDKIKTISSIEQLLTFSPVKLQRPRANLNNPWRLLSDNKKQPIERVDLLALFPNARQTDDTGRYWLCSCPFHGHRSNFWLDTELNICGCYAGCTSSTGNDYFLATEIIIALVNCPD